jgi:hypothetical protein
MAGWDGTLGWYVLDELARSQDGPRTLTVFHFQCWLSIPALVYLVAVPLYPRARRFGNVYAFAALDGLFVVLWFSAWVSVASYVAEGKSKGESDPNNKDHTTGCDAFAYGSASKCEISTGAAILGVFILSVHPHPAVQFASVRFC